MLSRSADDLFSISGVSTTQAQALANALRTDGSWLEVVAGIDSVVVRFDACSIDAADAEAAIRQTLQSPAETQGPILERVDIAVHYGGDDGPDFEEVCAALKLSGDELIELHTGGEYRVDMIGFTPGFAFIGGLDERLRIARRAQPRQQVAAGSIGIADGRTGIYSMSSPGGWCIIGRTDMRLFRAKDRDPFVLRPGMRVRFRDAARRDA